MYQRIYSSLPCSEVTLISPGNYTAQSISYRSIPQIIFENKLLDLHNKSSEFNKAYLEDDHGKIPRADTPLHQEIGPVLPDIFPGLTPDLDSFLATHPRTLYFALGTNVFIPPQSVITLLQSFLELLKQDIIDGVIWSTLRTDVSESL
ncbi:Glycosyltransferase Family 1 protein [Gigaspora rosea]|uniref:Glycosyltransferase Family 1 protein n=1 Tax=Gigaspora rosea TaxID=44941 RepID=A0A397VV97_9GLOM|nr:Glycosyltransferase Family 1 protein [Gigaspora rosea]